MKKDFPLHVAGQELQNVVGAIKLELVKYVKRERRKTLPEGSNFWDIQCRIGPDRAAPAPTPLEDLPAAIDAFAQAGRAQVYVEILAQPAFREVKSLQRPAPTAFHRDRS